MKPTILIAGAGGIGKAAALILAENPSLDCNIILGDVSDKAIAKSERFLTEGNTQKNVNISSFKMPMEGYNDDMKKAFEKAFQLNEIDFLTKDMALEKIDALKADFGY